MPQASEGSELLAELQEAHRRALGAMARRPEGERRWARGERPAKSWIGEVLAAGAGGGDYRDPVLDRERLLEVAEQPVADPSARAAAAAVLRRSRLEPAERDRIRVAAERAANPRLRVALEAASDEQCPEAELVRRLERCGKS
jgi:hypothetical protein